MTGTTMICAHCGRPIIGSPYKMGGSGDPYHLECTTPPSINPQPAKTGWVCPKCGGVNSPSAPICWHCQPKVQVPD